MCVWQVPVDPTGPAVPLSFLQDAGMPVAPVRTTSDTSESYEKYDGSLSPNSVGIVKSPTEADTPSPNKRYVLVCAVTCLRFSSLRITQRQKSLGDSLGATLRRPRLVFALFMGSHLGFWGAVCVCVCRVRFKVAHNSMRAEVAEIASLALPALGSVIADPLMSLVDTGCVGQLSSLQLASLGPNTAIFNFVFQVCVCV